MQDNNIPEVMLFDTRSGFNIQNRAEVVNTERGLVSYCSHE